MKVLLLACVSSILFAQAKIPLSNFIDLTSSNSVIAEPVSLSIGDSFTVQLKENPSTGYAWQLSESDLKENGL